MPGGKAQQPGTISLYKLIRWLVASWFTRNQISGGKKPLQPRNEKSENHQTIPEEKSRELRRVRSLPFAVTLSATRQFTPGNLNTVFDGFKIPWQNNARYTKYQIRTRILKILIEICNYCILGSSKQWGITYHNRKSTKFRIRFGVKTFNNHIMQPGGRNGPNVKEQIAPICLPCPGKTFIWWRRGQTNSLGEEQGSKLSENIAWRNNRKSWAIEGFTRGFPQQIPQASLGDQDRHTKPQQKHQIWGEISGNSVFHHPPKIYQKRRKKRVEDCTQEQNHTHTAQATLEDRERHVESRLKHAERRKLLESSAVETIATAGCRLRRTPISPPREATAYLQCKWPRQRKLPYHWLSWNMSGNRMCGHWHAGVMLLRDTHAGMNIRQG